MGTKIKNLKILITGGAGFIGSHLYDNLKDENKIIIIDSFIDSGFSLKNFSEAKIYPLDITAPEIKKIFIKERPQLIFHLAGPIHLREKITGRLFDNGLKTIEGFKKILDYSRDYGTKKNIFISSGGAIYEDAKIIPTPETYLPHPNSLYGIANLFLERLLIEYAGICRLKFSILRLSNVYGPRQWQTGAIPSFIISILKNKSPIITGDGKQTRDFIYIDDVMKAFLYAAKSGKNKIYNVGFGQEISLNDLFKKIANILNVKIKPKYIPLKRFGTKRSILDISKIKKELNWGPRYSLDEGLRKTILWFKAQQNLKS